MADTLELEIATPEREVVREQVTEAQIPACNGYIGALPGHAPLLAEMAVAGILSYNSGGSTKYLAVHGGFLEILPDRVRVLTDAAEFTTEIDTVRAEKARRKAENDMINPALGVDPAAALEAIMRAQARLDAAAKK